MLTDLIIEDYQSLRRVALRLAPFTVITGATGSGKSASRRAAELVAFNARGTDYIRRGQKSTTVGLGCQDEGWAVSIVRGARGSDSYKAAVMDPDGGEDPKTWEFTKLGGKVPEQVAELLRLEEINFAGQFDGPYLLTDVSGGEVARMLGRLTNVTLVFSAAREAVRRRKAIAADLKAAEAEVTRLQAEAQRFTTLKDRLGALQEATEALERLQAAQVRLGRITWLLASLATAQTALQHERVTEVPDTAALEQAWVSEQRLLFLVTRLEVLTGELEHQQAQVGRYQEAAAQAEEELHRLLAEAGTCPLCGSKIKR